MLLQWLSGSLQALTDVDRSWLTFLRIISATTSAWPPQAASCSALLAACSSSNSCTGCGSHMQQRQPQDVGGRQPEVQAAE